MRHRSGQTLRHVVGQVMATQRYALGGDETVIADEGARRNGATHIDHYGAKIALIGG